MRKITETEASILERLHQCRFLTSAQLQRLGVSKNIIHIRKVLRDLLSSSRPMIGKIEFGTMPGIGRLPALHHLTKSGAEALEQYFGYNSNQIYFPKNSQMFQRDYFHRVQTIDLHISARLLAESHENSELNFFHSYFDTIGANHHGKIPRKSLCRVDLGGEKYFIPDSLFQVTDPTGKPWIFSAEIYRNHTTKRTHTQLKNHLLAIEQGSISQQFGFPRGIPVLLVCESAEAMISLMARCAEDPLFRFTEDYFLFRTLADLQENLFHVGWQTYTGQKKTLFQ